MMLWTKIFFWSKIFKNWSNFMEVSRRVFEEKMGFGQKKWANGQKLKKKWAEKIAKNGLKSVENGRKTAILGHFWVFLS